MRQLFGPTSSIIFSLIWVLRKPELEVTCELFTSADEVSNWRQIKDQIVANLDEYVQLKENRIVKLRHVRNTLEETLEVQPKGSRNVDSSDNNFTLSKHIAHPVEAFVALHRIVKAIEDIELLFDEKDTAHGEDVLSTGSKLGILNSRISLPSQEDLQGCGEALVRLQEFYDLDIDDIVTGRIHPNDATHGLPSRLHMQSDDCYKLGQVAFESGRYRIAIKWFQKTLELSESIEESQSISLNDRKVDLREVLDYMAFAAYKNGQYRYAAEITKLWLSQEPGNERAEQNLEYYLEEIEHEKRGIPGKLGNDISFSLSNQTVQAETTLRSKYEPEFVPDLTKYEAGKDEVVRHLCRSSPRSINPDTCYQHVMNSFRSFNVEIIHREPVILRIYDLITDEEAKHLREAALPNLRRSTVFSKEGDLTTTDFRIAKTAWLSRESDHVVKRLDSRLSELLNLSTSGAETLQIVNYGSGGFFGPHLDAVARPKKPNSTEAQEHFNDRLATVLVYLDSVESGGATAFPRLGISVEPIKNSAVVWFNLLRNGLPDKRMLHVGCPILLGSKWIATEWLREDENIFLRPCGLKSHE